MGNEVIFWTQLGSIIVYVATLFTVYRVLVAAKDAAIQEKNATIENLKTRLEEAKGKGSDILVTQLRERAAALTEEIEKLSSDRSKDKGKLAELETERDILHALMLRSDKLRIIGEILENSRYEIYRDFMTSVCGSTAKASRAIYEFESLEKLITRDGKKLERMEDRTKLVLALRREEPGFIQASCWAKGIWVVYSTEVKVEMKLWKTLRSFHSAIRNEVEEIIRKRDKALEGTQRNTTNA